MSVITQTQFQDMQDRALHPFRQDVVGNNTIAVLANTEVLFTNNALARNDAQGPSYMSDRYDSVNNKFAVPSEYDGPVYVGDLGFTWTPTASSEGTAIVRVYIDTSGTQDFSTDPLIRSYDLEYKGALGIPRNKVTTWYFGDGTGYDAKNDGVYFTVEFEHAGSITNPSCVYYHTQ